MNSLAAASEYGCGTRERFAATSKSSISGTKAGISAATGGRSSNRCVSNRYSGMAAPLARNKKGRRRTISLAAMGRLWKAATFVAADLTRVFRQVRANDRYIRAPLESLAEFDIAV